MTRRSQGFAEGGKTYCKYYWRGPRSEVLPTSKEIRNNARKQNKKLPNFFCVSHLNEV